jgi:undecaprenyl-diphosphatase
MIINEFSNSFFIELILEGLPISSSGHLELLSYFFNSIRPLSFFYVHLSHLLIFFIQIIYLFPFFKILMYRKKWRLMFRLSINFISITILTAIGYLIKKIVIEKLFPQLSFPLPLGFLISTVFLISVYFINKTRSKVYYALSFKESIFLGLWQCIAFLPGVSRLATMLLGAQICKFTRKHSLFIAIAANAAISCGSLLYLIYYYYTIETVIFVFSWPVILKLLSTLIFSAVLFFLFIYLYNKNKIIPIIIYELSVFLIAYYLY